jgi:hypothetical protein
VVKKLVVNVLKIFLVILGLFVCGAGRAIAASDEFNAIDSIPETLNPNGVLFLELFTAESCPFCPSAERNLSDIAENDGIIAMSCMVDYFDAGKSSLLSRPFCRDQQDIFVHMLKSGSRYTPQLVINGASQLPGQDLQKVSAALQSVRDKGNTVQELEIRAGQAADSYDVILPTLAKEDEKFVLRITLVKRAADLSILKGAAQERERSPYNIATSLIEGGVWNGKETVWTVTPKKDGIGDGFIVTVQEQNTGKVVAAGEYRF